MKHIIFINNTPIVREHWTISGLPIDAIVYARGMGDIPTWFQVIAGADSFTKVLREMCLDDVPKVYQATVLLLGGV